MTEIKDIKLKADVTEQPTTEYVTFWGKLKGDIEKQEDLTKILSAIKKSISDLSSKYIRKQDKLTAGYNITIEKNSEDKTIISGPVRTSELYNDGIGGYSSEGITDEFVTRSFVADRLDEVYSDIEDTEFDLESQLLEANNKINEKQNKLTAGDGIVLEDNIISVTSSATPGDGKLTINLNGVKVADFTANQRENTVADISIQTVPNAEPQWAGKVLGLDEDGLRYKFYTIPEDIPEVTDASYEGKVLTVENQKPVWRDPQIPEVKSNILYVDVAPQYGPETTYIKNKTVREIYDAYKDGQQVIVKYHPDGNISGSTIYTSYMTLCTLYEEDGELASQSVVNFDYCSRNSGASQSVSITISGDDSVIVATYRDN